MTGENQDKLLGKNNHPVFGLVPNADPNPLPPPFVPVGAPHDDGTDFFDDKEADDEDDLPDLEDDEDFLDDEEDEG